MSWPNGFLLVLLALATLAVFVPWVVIWNRLTVLPLLPALTITLCWMLYERRLHSLAHPGDPLIRVDLLLIVPLVALDWLSAICSLMVRRLRERQNTTH